MAFDDGDPQLEVRLQTHAQAELLKNTIKNTSAVTEVSSILSQTGLV